MLAAVQDRYGPPDVVRIADVPRPEPDSDELLVEVHATTVNRTDCGYRAASPPVVRLFSGLRRPRARTLGNEFAGVVAEVGADVTGFAVGDRVLGYVEGPFGAHAEYLTVAETASIALVPEGIDLAVAAAATEGSHYALSFIRAAGIEADRRVMVYGATGAIGSAAVQLLVHLGAEVTAVCAGPHVELVRGLGAHRVIDYTTEDFTAGGHTYDVVLDAVGKTSFAACRPVLEPHGTYMSSELGRFSQNPILALVTPLLGGRRVRFPVPKHDQAMIGHLADLLGSGAFRPVIDRSYPLDRIGEAYEHVETGRKVGNVVIAVRDGARR